MSTPSHARPIPQTYVVRAVRRTVNDAGASPPVADEVIVDALLRNRRAFETGLRERLDDRFDDCDVMSAALRDVRLGGSVLIDLVYDVKSRKNLVTLSVGFTECLLLELGKLLVRVLREPVAVSVAPAPKRRAKATAPKPSGGWSTIAPVLAAIASGIGIIGFVTFVGGLFVWARLNGNGFPAAPALSVYPRQDLLVIGASTLVPQLLIALAVVAAMTVIYLLLRLVPRVKEKEQLVRAGHLARLTGLEMLGLAVFLAAVFGFLVLVGVSAHELFFVVPGLLLVGVIAGLIGLATRRFAYLATAAFLGIGILMSYVAYTRARDDGQVRGAAMIRAGQTPITGIYLTEGAGRVYFAQLVRRHDGSIDPAQSHIVGVAKGEVTDLAIAGAKPPKQADEDAEMLKAELCASQPASTKPKAGGCGPG